MHDIHLSTIQLNGNNLHSLWLLGKSRMGPRTCQPMLDFPGLEYETNILHRNGVEELLVDYISIHLGTGIYAYEEDINAVFLESHFLAAC